MNVPLTFEDFEPAAFILESRVAFLHNFKTAAKVIATTQDARLFQAHRSRLALNVNNYRLPLMTSLGKMPDTTSRRMLQTLVLHMSLLYEGRKDATHNKVISYSDNIKNTMRHRGLKAAV